MNMQLRMVYSFSASSIINQPLIITHHLSRSIPAIPRRPRSWTNLNDYHLYASRWGEMVDEMTPIEGGLDPKRMVEANAIDDGTSYNKEIFSTQSMLFRFNV